MRRQNIRTLGGSAANRADPRLYAVPDGRVFLLNKHDGVLRAIASDGG